MQLPILQQILPQSLQDKKILALSDALDIELNKLFTQAELVLHLPRLDQLPDNVLDQLAFQYHVDFYQTDFAPDLKRKMIRQSFFLHKIKGTPKAVEKFLSALMKNPTVEENWQYDGKPYFFKITTGGLFLDIDNEDDFLRLINHAKNLRSWLEAITFDLTIEEAEILSVAHIYSFGGNIFTDIKQPSGENIFAYHALPIKFSGIEKTDLAENYFTPATMYNLLQEKVAGFILTKADIDFDDNWFWKYLLLKKWHGLKDNPVIEIYHHRDHGKEKIITEDVTAFYFNAVEKYSGNQLTDATFQTFDMPVTDFYVAQVEKVGGIEIVEADYQADDLTQHKLLLLKNWQGLKDNPVIDFYKHREHSAEKLVLEEVFGNYFYGVEKVGGIEITDADFTYWEDDEPLPVGVDFLRLYFECGTGFRNLTLYNPKPNLSGAEIKPFGEYVVDKEVLQNSKGDLAEKLIRAKLFYKEIENIPI